MYIYVCIYIYIYIYIYEPFYKNSKKSDYQINVSQRPNYVCRRNSDVFVYDFERTCCIDTGT